MHISIEEKRVCFKFLLLGWGPYLGTDRPLDGWWWMAEVGCLLTQSEGVCKTWRKNV